MKFLVVLAVAVACASAVDDYSASILRQSFDNSPARYLYEYETGNGISAQVQGNVKNQNTEYPFVEEQGAFKYTAPDGTPVEVNYIANENGFQPQGSHLPVSPPIPEAILRSLKYIQEHPQPAEGVRTAPKPNFG